VKEVEFKMVTDFYDLPNYVYFNFFGDELSLLLLQNWLH